MKTAMYFSKTTNGFYDPAINRKIPKDAIEISIEEHRALLFGQAKGRAISSDENGRPILKDREPPVNVDVWASLRKRRDYLLSQSDWSQLPDVSQAVRQKWAAYRQALRDITKQHDPRNIVWPQQPM